jgi:hypothetical protein
MGTYTLADGSSKPVGELTCQTLRGADGSALGYLAVFGAQPGGSSDLEEVTVYFDPSVPDARTYSGDGTYSARFFPAGIYSTLTLTQGGKHGTISSADQAFEFDCGSSDDTSAAKGASRVGAPQPGTLRLTTEDDIVLDMSGITCSGYDGLQIDVGDSPYELSVDRRPIGFDVVLNYFNYVSYRALGSGRLETNASCTGGVATLSLSFQDQVFGGDYEGLLVCPSE